MFVVTTGGDRGGMWAIYLPFLTSLGTCGGLLDSHPCIPERKNAAGVPQMTWLVWVTLMCCPCCPQLRQRFELEIERMKQMHQKDREDQEEELEDVRQSCQKRVSAPWALAGPVLGAIFL